MDEFEARLIELSDAIQSTDERLQSVESSLVSLAEVIEANIGGPIDPTPDPDPAPDPQPEPEPEPENPVIVAPPAGKPPRVTTYMVGKMLVFDELNDGDRYVRALGLYVLKGQSTVTFNQMSAGGERHSFEAGQTCTLKREGVVVAEGVFSGETAKGQFEFDASTLPEGWGVFQIESDDSVAVPYPMFVMHGDEPIEQVWMPIVTGSYTTKMAGHHVIDWVPAVFDPVTLPLTPRKYVPFSHIPASSELWFEQLNPYRGGDVHTPNANEDGVISTANMHAYKWWLTRDEFPRIVIKDGPRGRGHIAMPMHIEIGAPPDEEAGFAGDRLYILSAWGVHRMSPDGEIKTMFGYRHKDMPSHHAGPIDVELVGDWSAISKDRRGLRGCWGMCTDQFSTRVDEDADSIPSEQNLKPHIEGVRQFVADTLHDRIVKAQYSATSHAAPAVVTEFITDLQEPWDTVLYQPDPDVRGTLIVSERKAHEINEYDLDTGEKIRTILSGAPLAVTRHDKMMQRTDNLAVIRQQDVVAPEGLAIVDDWLYFGSISMRQIRRVNQQTGELQVCVADFPNSKMFFIKLAVSDGTAGPKHTIFATSWHNDRFGGPDIFEPYTDEDGETRWKTSTWNLARGGSGVIERGKGGRGPASSYNSAVAARNGRVVFGAVSYGLGEVSLASQEDPALSSHEFSAAVRGRNEWNSSYRFLYGDLGFGYYGLSLPWGVFSDDVKAYLSVCGHTEQDTPTPDPTPAPDPDPTPEPEPEPMPDPVPAPDPAPDPDGDRPQNRVDILSGPLLSFSAYVEQERYNRWTPLVIFRHGQESEIGYNGMLAGGAAVDFVDGVYELLCDGEVVATDEPGADESISAFRFDPALLDIEEGYHIFDIRPPAGNSSKGVFCPFFVMRGETASRPQKWMPLIMGSAQHHMAGHHFLFWVPAQGQPIELAKDSREFVPFSDQLQADDLYHDWILVPRRWMPAHTRVSKEGVLTTATLYRNKIFFLHNKTPLHPIIEGPRGKACLQMITEIELGEPDNTYCWTVHGLYKFAPDGSMKCLAGYKHGDIPPHYGDVPSPDGSLQNVGDWSAVPEDRRGFWNVSGAGVDRHDPQAHVWYCADTLNNRVCKVVTAEGATSVVTEFLPTLAGPMDVKVYQPDPSVRGTVIVAEREAHRISEYTPEGEHIRDIVSGEALAEFDLARFVQRSANMAVIREEEVVAPDSIYIVDDWLYYASVAMLQAKRVHLQTGQIQVCIAEYPAEYRTKAFIKIAVSDGTAGPKHSIYGCKWSTLRFGAPDAFAAEGENTDVEAVWGAEPWKLQKAGSSALSRGAWGAITGMGYNLSVGAQNGRIVYSSANHGLAEVSAPKDTDPDPKHVQAAVVRGNKEYKAKGWHLRYGENGMGLYGDPLPWGVSDDIDAYLSWFGHIKPEVQA